MKYGLIRTLAAAAVAALLFSTACAGAVNHYAVATSANKLYLLWAEGTWAGTPSSVLNIGSFTGADIRGVATFGEWVYILDAASNSILAGKVALGAAPGSYGFNVLQTIKLESADKSLHVNQPYSLSVDGSGGVYVIGGQYTSGGTIHSSYAYVSGITTGTATVSVMDLLGASMSDVAAYSTSGGASSAVISHVLSGGTPQESYVSKVGSAGSAGPNRLSDSYNPGAVAVVDTGDYSIAYVLSRLSSTDPSNPYGTLDVIRLDTMTNIFHYAFNDDNLNPQDITTTTVDGTHYLGIVGRTMTYVDDEMNPGIVYGPAMALKVALDGSGIPLFSSKEVRTIPQSDNVAGHVMEFSGDGQVVWSVYPDGTQKVEAWKFNTWSSGDASGFSGSVSDTLTNIAHLVGLPVPEPSSYAAMLSMLGGMAFFARRRKR